MGRGLPDTPVDLVADLGRCRCRIECLQQGERFLKDVRLGLVIGASEARRIMPGAENKDSSPDRFAR